MQASRMRLVAKNPKNGVHDNSSKYSETFSNNHVVSISCP